MKKIILFINCILLSGWLFSQLNAVPPQSVQLRLKDWCWILAKQGINTDTTVFNLQMEVLKKVSDTVKVYGRLAAAEKEVLMPQIPAPVIISIYTSFVKEDYGVVWNMGNTAAERNLIAMRIKAIPNATIQAVVTNIDAARQKDYADDVIRIMAKKPPGQN